MHHVSFVIPVYNEQESLATLLEKILEHSEGHVESLEVIFVDDGSTDRSPEIIEDLCGRHTEVKALFFSFNYGKAAALECGFGHASGDTIITMDADLQDDPAEIPRFLAKLDEGYDLVSGWKQNRQDPWHKTLPSRFFNAVVRRTFDVNLHDFNCGYKAYRTRLIRRIHLYGELHRYVPVLAKYKGACIAEIPVRHYPRLHGVSKYGAERLIKGFLDLVTVFVTTRYLKRPLHFFGSFGLVCMLIGTGAMTYLGIGWCFGMRPIGNRPLLFYGLGLLLLGVQVFSLGILSELIIYFGSKSETPSIASRSGFEDA